MLGQFKPVSFDPYRHRRSRLRPPRWLVLLVSGVAVGVAGVLVVQERYLPPRLSVHESAELRSSYTRSEGERQRLAGELDAATKRLNAALGDKKTLTDELAASRQTVTRLQADVASLVASLPPDPRGGAVEVRAARMTNQRGALAYEVVLTRERGGGRPLNGVMQLLVSGAAAGGASKTVTLPPIEISLGGHQSLRGTLPLPDDFDPQQTTIKVLDRVDGKQLGMRVMIVH